MELRCHCATTDGIQGAADISANQCRTVFAGSQLNVQTQENGNTSQGLELRRGVRETDTRCSEGFYPGGNFCCQPCQPGEWKVSDCTFNEGKPSCRPCTEGKEYMDGKHYSDKCKRCGLCDGEHGLEVETNCTRTQNTKCKCKENFYCNASVCEHCEQCISCEHGILEPCTKTSNTKCKEKDSRTHLLWLLIIPISLVIILYGKSSICLNLLWKKYYKKRHDNPEFGIWNPSSQESVPINVSATAIPLRKTFPETCFLFFSDVDLSIHIPSIAEQMTINEVKKFARVNKIPEAKIDEIKNDHMQNTAEQKIQLLRSWYQSHGKKDAYRALVKGLKEANCSSVVEGIRTMIQEHPESSCSDVRNESERQNLG
ncbi:tumor necrosis factor receptor superfamily member 6 [Acomys russatus]|uniref:tumor necrosis factor receptor superfamily member 6 n=1 Tax=Acomys russatus TaxID=60746 RepID=UPI0021E2EB3A|nr:tumor necrosis factor receptor superfamily member 6 [Acomys russatus]